MSRSVWMGVVLGGFYVAYILRWNLGMLVMGSASLVTLGYWSGKGWLSGGEGDGERY